MSTYVIRDDKGLEEACTSVRLKDKKLQGQSIIYIHMEEKQQTRQ